MLRIIQNVSAEGAKGYYSTADYYSEGQELEGSWRGIGAEMLGLRGRVDQTDWDALCDNRRPDNGDPLTLRTKENRRIGYDFNFHVPKSVSLLYSLTDDEHIVDAFRRSVQETMREIESEVQARVRKDGRNEDRATANLVWGEFVHFTSRPIDQIPDPHLHAHCFVFNSTFDSVEKVWKAGEFSSIKRDAGYFEARFHSRLATRLMELGLEVERNRTGWELKGFSRQTLEKFSRRTVQIEAEARRRGITDPTAKAELGAKTRSRKANQLTMSQLRDEWTARLSPEERSTLAEMADRVGRGPVLEDPDAARLGITLAADHLFERQSVVPERRLLAESIKRSVGRATVGSVEQEFAKAEFLTRERHGRRFSTTPTVLEEERRMLEFARKGRGTRRAFKPVPHQFHRAWLNDGQKKAVEHVLQSRDRVILIRGVAGTGKTSMMQEAVEAIEATGSKVLTFAPSAKASRGVLRDKGFESADTVARLLMDETLQQQIAGGTIWIDEAGMVGARTMSRLFELADRVDARVILSGDRFQHGSVERGAALRLLEEEAGLVPAEIRDIQRQKAAYRQAVADLSEARITSGFQRLDQMDWIREVSDSERYRVLAGDYISTIRQGESALIVSPTHLEADRITVAIRDQLREDGLLKSTQSVVPVLRKSDMTEGERGDVASFVAGDVLVFHQNAKGFRKGQRFIVQETGKDVNVPVDHASRFQVYSPSFLDVAVGETLRITQNGRTADGKGRLNNGDLVQVTGFDEVGNILTRENKTIAHNFGHLDYGYCVTSHQSQGSDVDRVFIGQSSASFGASSTEQFYVSVSRGKKQATIYTDNKTDLLDAVRRSDERLSATELLNEGMLEEVLIPGSGIRSSEPSGPGYSGEPASITQERELVLHDR